LHRDPALAESAITKLEMGYATRTAKAHPELVRLLGRPPSNYDARNYDARGEK
jgi:hypothetical protein